MAAALSQAHMEAAGERLSAERSKRALTAAAFRFRRRDDRTTADPQEVAERFAESAAEVLGVPVDAIPPVLLEEFGG